MIIHDRVPRVQRLFFEAAVRRKTLSFSNLFQQFEPDTAGMDVYDTLEAATVELADFRQAIYSALLAKAGTGLPGDGFFDIFRIYRDSEYRHLAGTSCIPDLTDEQKAEMARNERCRVFEHALTLRQTE